MPKGAGTSGAREERALPIRGYGPPSRRAQWSLPFRLKDSTFSWFLFFTAPATLCPARPGPSQFWPLSLGSHTSPRTGISPSRREPPLRSPLATQRESQSGHIEMQCPAPSVLPASCPQGPCLRRTFRGHSIPFTKSCLSHLRRVSLPVSLPRPRPWRQLSFWKHHSLCSSHGPPPTAPLCALRRLASGVLSASGSHLLLLPLLGGPRPVSAACSLLTSPPARGGASAVHRARRPPSCPPCQPLVSHRVAF